MYKTNGTGKNAMEMKPRRELPQPRPKASYMAGPAIGSKDPSRHRKMVLAAVTEAAWVVYASTRYMALGIYSMLAK